MFFTPKLQANPYHSNTTIFQDLD